MRRLLAVVAVLFLSACSDRHAQGPFGPFGAPQYSEGDGAQNSLFWLLGQASWTQSDGSTCTYVENYGGVVNLDGTLCVKDGVSGGVFTPWPGNNTDLYPVVEICRLITDDLTTDEKCSTSPEDRAFFFRDGGAPGMPQIRVPGRSGKYTLSLNGQGNIKSWWDRAGRGKYRIIVAITYTGGTETAPIPGWDIESKKVLGYFDHERTGTNSNLRVQFRIAPGALCLYTDCVETAFDPDEDFVLILDEGFKQSVDDVGVVGIKFPVLAGYTKQTQINVIFERIKRADLGTGENCLEAGYKDLPYLSKEVGDCYRVRTEPYIDLKELAQKYEDYDGEFIKFGICYDDALPPVEIYKYSYVTMILNKLKLLDVDQPDNQFMYCDNSSLSLRNSGFGSIRSRFMAAAASVLMPAPLHARRGNRLVMGGLSDFSAITLVTEDPLILPLDPLLWLDASSLDLAHGARVASWPNLSNNANNAVQADEARQPVLNSAGIGGRRTVTFDGTDDFLTTGNVTTGNSTTVFAVTRATDKEVGDGVEAWKQGHGVVNQYALFSHMSYIWIEIQPDAGAVQTWAGAWTVAQRDMTAARITTVRVENSAVNIFVDGDAAASGGAAGSPGRTAPLRIGYTGDQSRYLKGDIAEIIIYNRALPTAERVAVETYLKAKYGIK